jgi:hypothetical protein
MSYRISNGSNIVPHHDEDDGAWRSIPADFWQTWMLRVASVHTGLVSIGRHSVPMTWRAGAGS